jgi:hypothetical protein
MSKAVVFGVAWALGKDKTGDKTINSHYCIVTYVTLVWAIGEKIGTLVLLSIVRWAKNSCVGHVR